MNCSKHREKLHSYASGHLSDRERMEIASHLVDCPECSRELKEIRYTADFMKRHKATPLPPRDLKLDIMASINPNRYQKPKPKPSSLFDMANWGFSMVAAGLVIFILSFAPIPGAQAISNGQIMNDNLGKRILAPLTNIYNSANSAVNNIDKLNGITMRMEIAIKGGM